MRVLKFATVLLVMSEVTGVSSAVARGGYPLNSPGYQRRLQESRGYVTNRSGSFYAADSARQGNRIQRRHWR